MISFINTLKRTIDIQKKKFRNSKQILWGKGEYFTKNFNLLTERI